MLPEPSTASAVISFFGRAVQNKCLAARRDAIYQTAAIGAGNQVSLGVECQRANVHFIALEEEGMLPVFGR